MFTNHIEHDIGQRRALVELVTAAGTLKLHYLAKVNTGALHRRRRDAPFVQRRPEPDSTVFNRHGPVCGNLVHLLGHPTDQVVHVADYGGHPALHLFGAFLQFRDQPVDLVNKQRRFDTLPKRLPQNSLGLWHRAFDGIDDDQRAVDGPHRPCHVTTKVDVAWRVDQID